MKRDNVIEIATHRGRTLPKDAAARSAKRDADHSDKPADLLEALRKTKRIKDDQPILVGNLGHLVERLEPKNPKGLAQRILLPAHWPKRKRYIRFPNDGPNQSGRYAASGLTFAGIIDRLVEEKVRKGFDRTQAMIRTVYGALKGTSFRRPPRFQMPVGVDGDAAYFVRKMEKAFDKLAQDTDLPEYFELVSKYPIYPVDGFSCLLKLKADKEPNDLYSWDSWCTDEYEFQTWIPWWAPKCVIGHLYIRFQCSCLHLPEQGIAEIKKACGGEVTRDNWKWKCSSLLKSFVAPEWIHQQSVYHRLPVWLITLPSRTGLVPCLYASIYCKDYFQIEDSLKSDEDYYSYDNATTPCFVHSIGERINNDGVYFCDSDDNDFWLSYIHASKAGIKIIGYAVDSGVENFKSEFLLAESIDETPDWLHSYPVQRLLKLTMDSDEAKLFALSPRNFPGKWHSDRESVFRPAFSDPVMQYTPQLRQDTIAAYLLRNFVDVDASIFEVLKNDAFTKAAAARELIDGELSKFQEAFDKRYGK